MGGERNATILIVDDDRAVRDALRRVLSLGGYEVQTAADGAQALDAIAGSLPDAVVLDLGMPAIDGLEVCRRVRFLHNRVPILILTARDAVADRIDGLDVGADDYMVKPFDVGELKARLRALLRRSGAEPARAGTAPAPSFAEITLDCARHGAVVSPARPAAGAAQSPVAAGPGGTAGAGPAAQTCGGSVIATGASEPSGGSDAQFVELTRTEYHLLELLLAHPREVLSHASIYEQVWGYDFGPASNSLRVYVGYLRRKLAAAGARPLIHNVRGVGYVMREP